MARSKQKDDELLKVTLEMKRATYNKLRKILQEEEDQEETLEKMVRLYEAGSKIRKRLDPHRIDFPERIKTR